MQVKFAFKNFTNAPNYQILIKFVNDSIFRHFPLSSTPKNTTFQ